MINYDSTPEQDTARACKDPKIIAQFMRNLPDPDGLDWGAVEVEWGSGKFKSPLEIIVGSNKKYPSMLLTGEDAQRFYRRATGDNWGD